MNNFIKSNKKLISCNFPKTIVKLNYLGHSQKPPLFRNQKYNFVFGYSNRKVEKSHYETLGVPFDADIDTIKKKYFTLAKQYHPDLNEDSGSEEMFKKIKEAYEVIGDPNNRVTYDMENNFQNDNSKYVKKGKGNNRVNVGPRTINEFYGDKWSEYKKPNWYNIFSGADQRSDYMARKREFDNYYADEEENFQSISKSRLNRYIENNRVFLYFILAFVIDLFFFVDNYQIIQIYKLNKEMFINNSKNEISKDNSI